MFDYHCPACERRQLVFPSQVDRIVNDDEGIAVLLTCWCGAPGAIRTGRATSHAEHALAS